MSKYGKWLGGGLGWLIGGPIGGVVGFVAGNMMEDEPKAEAAKEYIQATELEACLMVMASHVIRAEGKVSLVEIDMVRRFLVSTSGTEHVEEKIKVLHHCLNHDYEIEKACGFVRIYQSQAVALQSLRLMFDVAVCDGALTEAEQRLLFYISGQLNINDVLYKKLLHEWTSTLKNDHELLKVNSNATLSEIRSAYRKQVLLTHPDRNPNYTELERKNAEVALQQLREAYQRLMKGEE